MATDLKGFIRWIDKSLLNFDQLRSKIEHTYHDLVSRLYPLIEQFKPIWQDPLWQFIGIVLLIFFGILLGLWLIKKTTKGSVWLIKSLLRVVTRFGKTLFRPIRWLVQKMTGKKQREPSKKNYRQRLGVVQMRRAINAIQYLTTKREWRYQASWALLIGESESGKSQLIQSVKQGRRAQLLPKEKRLLGANNSWHFFDHGVVIESASDALDDNLEQLNWYRPERALDKIILCVSAKSLLNQEPPAVLEALGEQLFQQLWKIQKKTGFVLPVYVFVTQCDEVEGFAAFWQAQGKEVEQQMIGWSNPYRLETAFNLAWLNEAFGQLLSSMQSAQLRVASGGEEITNIDQFMLFLNQFSALQAPLTKVMQSTFARSSLQEALPLRGIYFCGQLEDKTAFVEDAFQQKIFAEKHLGSILEKRRFSSNKVLRRFQFGAVGAALVLSLLLAFDVTRVVQFNSFSQAKLKQLNPIASDCTVEGADTYELLQGLSDIGQRLVAFSMPLSWLDIMEVKKQQLIAVHLLESKLFPSMDCRLKQRANALTIASQVALKKGNYPALVTQLKDYQSALIAFEKAQQAFVSLAGPLENSQGVSKQLTHLLNYLYNNYVPDNTDLDSDLIVGGVRRAQFSPPWIRNDQRLVSHQLSTKFLDTLTKELHLALLVHAEDIPLAPLQKFNAQADLVTTDRILPASSVIEDYQRLSQWIDHTRHDWLSSSAASSPCGQLSEQMTALRHDLVRHGFDWNKLNQMVMRFSQQSCDQTVRNELAELSFVPFGVLFTFDQQGLLSLSPDLQRLAEKLQDITELTFIQDSYPPVIDSSETIVQWQEIPLQQLVDALINFQQFSADHSDTNIFDTTLAERFQQVTERLLSQAMIRPAQRIKAPKPINDLIAYHEKSVSEAVKSFKQVQELLLQIQILLQQQGDSSNVLWLKQQVQAFIIQQLTQLEKLVAEYHLYLPLSSPQWQKPDFAQAMFNLSDQKQAELYLTNQQQKMSYFAFNYAQPLLQYLQNSDTGLSNLLVQRWLATLQDLGRFERGEPNNQVTLLNDLVTQKLTAISNEQCSQSHFFDGAHGNQSWFAKRRGQIEQQVNLHCSSADKKALVTRYMQLAQAFNATIAGRYPFADSQLAGNKDLTTKALQAFLADYRQNSANLLADLNKQHQKDGSIPDAWLEFIGQMNNISDFFAHTWQPKAKRWQVTLDVTFDAKSYDAKGRSSKGSNQIIEWTLQSGQTQALFPNGDTSISWSPGQPLQLDLRWATGSAYVPIGLPGSHSAPRQVGTRQGLTAGFVSRSRWGLFEWLAVYGSEAREREDDENILSFYVPVGLKGEQVHLEEPAYVSRANLLLQALVSDDKGEPQAIALPRHFPIYAPGLNH
ncbi:type VI secretion system protein [Marinomonas transparens]|uniref:Type VI secretion system component TssM1 N-terminal domain-containing protein n=1 Tax=Marinomonas transparens TaxID=2795388 RepID=A0A934JXG5_9GAMM|nr:type VI secretion system protein [Marinomonas transparens]MBJ7540002.1 hypothetical protein [Marinomonas transparens]